MSVEFVRKRMSFLRCSNAFVKWWNVLQEPSSACCSYSPSGCSTYADLPVLLNKGNIGVASCRTYERRGEALFGSRRKTWRQTLALYRLAPREEQGKCIRGIRSFDSRDRVFCQQCLTNAQLRFWPKRIFLPNRHTEWRLVQAFVFEDRMKKYTNFFCGTSMGYKGSLEIKCRYLLVQGWIIWASQRRKKRIWKRGDANQRAGQALICRKGGEMLHGAWLILYTFI